MNYRKNIRLPDYDYSQNGYYFVTICAKDRQSYFDNKDVCEMIKNMWYKLSEKYIHIRIDMFEIMPNHIHGIIIVGADPCVRPYDSNGPTRRSAPTTLFEIIQWFKTMTTNYYINGVKNNHWKPFVGKLWQRGYYEHVIRNESALNKIREYIQNNPEEEKYDWDKLDVQKH